MDSIHIRGGSRSFVVTTAGYEQYKVTRVGLTLDDVIEAEFEDYRQGLKGAEARGVEADDYAAREDDRAVWEGVRLRAVIRPRVGGDPEVTILDQAEDQRPLPTTEEERFLLAIVREYGVEPCRQAILEKLMPGYGSRPKPVVLTAEEGSVLHAARTIGVGEAMDRIFMMGPYQVIRDAINRLGSDAVAELRRMIGDRGTER